MEYKGKLYGKVGNTYVLLENTTEDFDRLEKRCSELEARQQMNSDVIGSLEVLLAMLELRKRHFAERLVR